MRFPAMGLVIKLVRKVLILITVLLAISCWHREMEETGIIIINNGLDNYVDLKFFRNGLPSERKTISKTGQGIICKLELEF